MSSQKINMFFTTKPTYSKSLNTNNINKNISTISTRSLITNTNINYGAIGNILYSPKTSCKSCGGG